MRRVISVWLPQWPLDRLSRAWPGAVPSDLPFVLVRGTADTGGRAQILHAVNRAARAAGLHADLSLADARAAVPGLVTRPAEIVHDRVALRRLALWAGRYGPRRNSDGDDGLWIDVTGVAHLFGGEARLMADLVGRLDRAGITAQTALADTLGAAVALARYGPGASARCAIVPPGGQAAALAALPVDALRLSPEAVLLLKRLGLRRIGQLYDLPRAALERRFHDAAGKSRAAARLAGTAVRTLLVRLDMALGQAAEPRRPLVEPPQHRVQHLFAEPLISPEGLASAAAAAMAELAAGLDACGLGVRRVRLSLFRADGTVAAVAAGTSAPTRDARHLLALLADRIAALDAGFGIDAVAVEATRTETMTPAEVELAGRLGAGARADPAPFLDRLTARLGTDRAIRLAPVASHWPERAERAIPVLAGAAPERRWPDPAGRGPRPPLLFPMPEPIAVVAEVPDGPPARFTWRRVGHRVVRAEGPERIAPEWWRTLGATGGAEGSRPQRTRDYYRIEDDRGGRFWVFREGLFEREAEHGPPAWYLHGVFG